jgi:UTP--glucose-1-phosphate uridylyltransferase
MSTVAELMQKDPDAAVALFLTTAKPLQLSPGAESQLISRFKSAFLPGASQRIEIDWNLVKPLTDEEMFPYDQLPEPANPSALLNELVLLKLNGGLGTTMGCTFPKSLIVCQNGQRFFDIVVDQLKAFNSEFKVNVPLVLMHSFYTDDQMKPVIQSVQGLEILTFLQNRFPRIYEDTLEPVPTSPDAPNAQWNPPGHADVYHCLRDSGLLEKFLSAGKKYVMISNFDNLGARIDLKVLNKLATDNIPYICETVTKTPEEWKGGMPINYSGHKKLLETAQVPPDHMNDYIAIEYFHANNLWVNLAQLKHALDTDTLVTDVIKNIKVYEGRKVVQLESAAGSAVQAFPRAIAIKVPRRRFLPVKACNELLLMRADLYLRQPNAELLLNPKRTVPGLPAVSLDARFQKVEAFEARIPSPPSIYNLVALKVEGDVIFGKGVVLEGTVDIIVPEGAKVVIPDGAHLKDVKITAQADLK